MRSGAEKYGSAEELFDGRVLRQLRVRVLQRVPTAAGDHLGEVPLAGLARVQQRPRLDAGERDGIHPERSHHVRVGLEREHLAGPPGRGLPGPDHERDVDVAQLQPQPGFEQRPCAVHLDVALVHRRPRARRRRCS